eukprot:TRINITY_DN34155_c0_g1_i1.p1 TRINITY_DN34155_c0_g1~~TRINITY_DN34155_c0_g1_i1.p1  ORF type:complete len:817 (+),score=93.94 TRINITY_DN34155_c0_g1_i1:80-2530(+)
MWKARTPRTSTGSATGSSRLAGAVESPVALTVSQPPSSPRKLRGGGAAALIPAVLNSLREKDTMDEEEDISSLAGIEKTDGRRSTRTPRSGDRATLPRPRSPKQDAARSPCFSDRPFQSNPLAMAASQALASAAATSFSDSSDLASTRHAGFVASAGDDRESSKHHNLETAEKALEEKRKALRSFFPSGDLSDVLSENSERLVAQTEKCLLAHQQLQQFIKKDGESLHSTPSFSTVQGMREDISFADLSQNASTNPFIKRRDELQCELAAADRVFNALWQDLEASRAVARRFVEATRAARDKELNRLAREAFMLEAHIGDEVAKLRKIEMSAAVAATSAPCSTARLQSGVAGLAGSGCASVAADGHPVQACSAAGPTGPVISASPPVSMAQRHQVATPSLTQAPLLHGPGKVTSSYPRETQRGAPASSSSGFAFQSGSTGHSQDDTLPIRSGSLPVSPRRRTAIVTADGRSSAASPPGLATEARGCAQDGATVQPQSQQGVSADAVSRRRPTATAASAPPAPQRSPGSSNVSTAVRRGGAHVGANPVVLEAAGAAAGASAPSAAVRSSSPVAVAPLQSQASSGLLSGNNVPSPERSTSLHSSPQPTRHFRMAPASTHVQSPLPSRAPPRERSFPGSGPSVAAASVSHGGQQTRSCSLNTRGRRVGSGVLPNHFGPRGRSDGSPSSPSRPEELGRGQSHMMPGGLGPPSPPRWRCAGTHAGGAAMTMSHSSQQGAATSVAVSGHGSGACGACGRAATTTSGSSATSPGASVGGLASGALHYRVPTRTSFSPHGVGRSASPTSVTAPIGARHHETLRC